MATSTRPGELTDIAELTELMDLAVAELRTQRGGEVFVHHLHGTATHSAIIEEALNDDDTIVWCGLWEHAIVGYAIARRSTEESGVVELREIYTIPEARDVGVGEALVESVLAWAIANEARSIDAQTLPGARESKNLFERFGLTARLITVRRDLE